MRITWVNPSFRNYRLAVYGALDRQTVGQLTVIYSTSRTDPTTATRLSQLLGDRAVGLTGEKSLSFGNQKSGFANESLRVPYQPALYRQLRHSDPDVVIAEGFFQWTPAALLLRSRVATPLVVAYERTAHTERHSGRARLTYRRWLTRRVDAILANGSLTKQYCQETLGMSEDRIFLGGMAADGAALQRQLANRDRLSVPQAQQSERPIFLYVGRLVRSKGVSELLDGWAQHRASNVDGCGSLWLVGEGPEEQRLRDRVNEERLGGVHFLGRVDHDSIGHVYSAADVFVMPTLEDNWSLAVAEALALGLPLVCSRYNGGWPELVRPENGIVFDPLVTESTARALSHWVNRPDKIRSMGAASLQIAEEFTPDRAAQSALMACSSAIRSRPTAS